MPRMECEAGRLWIPWRKFAGSFFVCGLPEFSPSLGAGNIQATQLLSAHWRPGRADIFWWGPYQTSTERLRNLKVRTSPRSAVLQSYLPKEKALLSGKPEKTNGGLSLRRPPQKANLTCAQQSVDPSGQVEERQSQAPCFQNLFQVHLIA